MTKRKKRDPLDKFKQMHPTPWKVTKGHSFAFNVRSSTGKFIIATDYRTLARAIAKLGAK